MPSASVYIPDSEKSCDSDPVVINRYIAIEAPDWSVSAVLSPGQCSAGSHTGACQQHYRCADRKTSRKRRKKHTEPYRIIDTFQDQLKRTQTSLDLLPQYDTDIESRANELWKKAVHTINNTTRKNAGYVISH